MKNRYKVLGDYQRSALSSGLSPVQTGIEAIPLGCAAADFLHSFLNDRHAAGPRASRA